MEKNTKDTVRVRSYKTSNSEEVRVSVRKEQLENRLSILELYIETYTEITQLTEEYNLLDMNYSKAYEKALEINDTLPYQRRIDLREYDSRKRKVDQTMSRRLKDSVEEEKRKIRESNYIRDLKLNNPNEIDKLSSRDIKVLSRILEEGLDL